MSDENASGIATAFHLCNQTMADDKAAIKENKPKLRFFFLIIKSSYLFKNE